MEKCLGNINVCYLVGIQISNCLYLTSCFNLNNICFLKRDAGHYYNMSTPDSNNWDANDNSYIYSNSQQAQTQQKQIQQHHQQLPPPQPQQQPKSYHYNYQTNYNSSNHANSFDNRIDMVDLQNSREKNGSAFDLYRKPLNVNSRYL